MSTFWTRWSNDYEPIGEYRIRQRRKSNFIKKMFFNYSYLLIELFLH